MTIAPPPLNSSSKTDKMIVIEGVIDTPQADTDPQIVIKADAAGELVITKSTLIDYRTSNGLVRKIRWYQGGLGKQSCQNAYEASWVAEGCKTTPKGLDKKKKKNKDKRPESTNAVLVQIPAGAATITLIDKRGKINKTLAPIDITGIASAGDIVKLSVPVVYGDSGPLKLDAPGVIDVSPSALNLIAHWKGAAFSFVQKSRSTACKALRTIMGSEALYKRAIRTSMRCPWPARLRLPCRARI